MSVDATGVLKRSKVNFGARWLNSNTTTNLNVNNTLAPIFGNLSYRDDGTNLYQSTAATTLTVVEQGRYDIRANLSLVGIDAAGNTERRTNVNARIAVNGIPVGAIAASGYIRFTDNQYEHSSIQAKFYNYLLMLLLPLSLTEMQIPEP